MVPARSTSTTFIFDPSINRDIEVEQIQALHHGHENNSHPPPATARHKAGLPVRIRSHLNFPNSSSYSYAPLTSYSIQSKLHPNPPPPAPRHTSHLRLLHRAAKSQQARPTRLSLERVRSARQGRAELYPAAESKAGSAGRKKACAAKVVSAQGSEKDDGGAGGAFCMEGRAGELGGVCDPIFFGCLSARIETKGERREREKERY
jgi:hypothetical protein